MRLLKCQNNKEQIVLEGVDPASSEPSMIAVIETHGGELLIQYGNDEVMRLLLEREIHESEEDLFVTQPANNLQLVLTKLCRECQQDHSSALESVATTLAFIERALQEVD